MGRYASTGWSATASQACGTNDGITASVKNDVFTLLPGPATRVLAFTGPVGSFRVAYPRVSDAAPPRQRQLEMHQLQSAGSLDAGAVVPQMDG